MPDRPKIALCEERLAMARMILDHVRSLSVVYLEPGGISATDMGTFLIYIAAFIGMAEGKPMSAHKLSQYLGIPRATVVRKLNGMAAVGAIELRRGKAVLPLATLNSPKAIASTQERLADLAATYRLVSQSGHFAG